MDNYVTAGACTRLEMAFGSPRLWCACRHHIFELVAKAVFNVAFPGHSVCPGEKIIQDFSSWWSRAENVPRDFTASDWPDHVDDAFKDSIEEFRWL